MAGQLEGKVAVVTGAASGIGAAIARRFVAEGACVVLADLQVEAADAVAGQLGPAAVALATDVSDDAAVGRAVDLAVQRFGGLDVMVNNAGIVGVLGRIADTPPDAWDRTVSVLLRGVYSGMRHAARAMVPQGRGGAILSIASTAGVMGGLGPHCYTACKHAVVGLTKSVASELGADRIRVNAIAPGNTVTAMTASVITGDPGATEATTKAIASMSPLGDAGLPEDIADAAVFLASDQARMVTGHTLLVDAGQTIGAGQGRVHQQGAALLREAGRRDALDALDALDAEVSR
jgi:NAD(P)-dependent dehydrogenase (short-subunit alcohol dehydrogenase family)